MDYFKIETTIGDIYILPQGLSGSAGSPGHTAYVELGHSPNGTYEERQNRTYATVRGVDYYGSCHVFQWSDGLFHVGREWATDGNYKLLEPRRQSSEYDRMRDMHFSRRGLHAYGKDKPSDSARAVLVAAIEKAVNDWIRTNQYILDTAEQERLQAERDKKLAKIQELVKQMHIIQAEVSAIEDSLKENLVQCASCGAETNRSQIVECNGCGWSRCKTCHIKHVIERREGKRIAEPECIAAYPLL